MSDPAPELKIVVVYVYPVMGGNHDHLAARFVESYLAHLPQQPHRLVVVSNGGQPTSTMRALLSRVKYEILMHDDTGWDIGAYRKAAKEIQGDLMVFLGGSTYLRGKRWLERMVESFQKHGPALYGVMGNQGDAKVKVAPHIRTTGWWMPPALLNQYPVQTTSDQKSRYGFEHGPHCLTSWIKSKGLKVFVVTWSGEYEWPNWDSIPNGFHQGNQSALLVGDRLTEPPYWPTS